MTIPSVDRYDSDGYPTEAALDALRTFEGTPAELVEFAVSLYSGGNIRTTDLKGTRFGANEKRVELTTGDSPGAEAVNEALKETLFHHVFWVSNHSDGLNVYLVPESQWESDAYWGNPMREGGSKDADAILNLNVTVMHGVVEAITVPIRQLAHVEAEQTELRTFHDGEAVDEIQLVHRGVGYTRTQNVPEIQGGKAMFWNIDNDGELPMVIDMISSGIMVDGKFWEKVNEDN